MYVPCEPFESDTSVGRVFVDFSYRNHKGGENDDFSHAER